MSVRLGVLGPVEATTAAGPVALKGSRPRAVLARLLVARGRVVPVDTLVEDLWGGPADGAVAAIRTFVADLRRVLEPDRPPRQPARLLVTVGPGYALRAAPDAADAWRFETAVADAGRQLAAGQAGTALAGLDEALGLWRGPAYDGFDWARAEIDRLDGLRLLAVERRAMALLALGRAEDVADDLRGHVEAHPLREDGWQLLATALYRAGRQGEALAALRQARATLVAELGVDPGPRLRALESDILSHRVAFVATSSFFFGRDRELRVLTRAAGPGLALVSGEAGAGKTALVQTLARRLEAQGWTAEWVRIPENEGGVVSWPWRAGAAAHLAALAVRGPVLLVVDDLHRADRGTLDDVAGLVGEPVFLLGTYRPTDLTPELTAALARFARGEPVRVELGGLSAQATGELAAAVAGWPLDAATVHMIHRSSGGNPFFVRELARVLAAEGPAGLRTVPAGVRDVIRHRLAGLPESARAVLRQASVLGRDVDVAVLGEVVGAGLLDALDAALAAGFLTEDGGLRFTHVLVRDTLYVDLSAARRATWHTAVAEAYERVAPGDVVALAHHFGRAGSRRSVPYARVAAQQAEQRADPHEAARLWRQVLSVDGSDTDATLGLARALAVTGHLAEARRLRARAVEAVAAFDVPAIWARNDDEELSRQIVSAALLSLEALPPERLAERSRLLSTIALELRGTITDEGHRAACEAEILARECGDPAVLAFALNARFMHSFTRAGMAGVRLGIGAELVTLSAKHGLVTFEVLGRLIVLQSHCALGSFDEASAQASTLSELAHEFDLPMVGVFLQWYAALHCSVSGAPSAVAYHRADALLDGAEMPGMATGLLSFALFSIGEPVKLEEPYALWGRPLALLAEGRREEALLALRSLPPSPRDQLYEARLCLAARAAVALGDSVVAARVYAELLPADGELAGAGSGVLSLGPVRDHLRELGFVVPLGQD